MNEDFLCYIWQHRYFNTLELKTTAGTSIEVLKVGYLNPNSGPDFLEVQLKLDGILWVGTVEIDLHSKGWQEHQHLNNPQYTNVILHVVYDYDAKHTLHSIPVLELKSYIPKSLLEKAEHFKANKLPFPCFNSIHQLEPLKLYSWLDALVIERLEQKIEPILTRLKETKGDWQQVVYEQFLSTFGLKINTYPFQRLAQALPLKYIENERLQPYAIESLFFGQAGFLESSSSEHPYVQHLKTTYQFLKQKYTLQALEVHLWQFSKLRPLNFPSVRLMQAAYVLKNTSALVDLCIKTTNLETIYKAFDIEPDAFWKTHYTLEKESSQELLKTIGKTTKENFILNTLIPLNYAYGVYHQQERYKEQALHWLEVLKAEQNSILEDFKAQKIEQKTAYDTQGLLQLHKHYCLQKRCLQCRIGQELLFKA